MWLNELGSWITLQFIQAYHQYACVCTRLCKLQTSLCLHLVLFLVTVAILGKISLSESYNEQLTSHLNIIFHFESYPPFLWKCLDQVRAIVMSQFTGCSLILPICWLMSFCLSLWKIARCSVILLLPLCHKPVFAFIYVLVTVAILVGDQCRRRQLWKGTT